MPSQDVIDAARAQEAVRDEVVKILDGAQHALELSKWDKAIAYSLYALAKLTLYGW